ncbi:hypothetical protein EG68_04916 [Paragonimus skrjabini miyazakii]|uniref:Uncharacterized protein n=1 Tax=Paragonimus skrjabini miyazakii TaxID=59628 RepID=A0A8S9YAX5_9TREM|nr:hypothetical protein EG68_04916 [Paragonimus skrjabini miyazakii]
MNSNVFSWNVLLNNVVKTIEIVHNLFSGKRKVFLDTELIYQTGFLLNLAGTDCFIIENHHCEIIISPCDLFSFDYRLVIDGKDATSFSNAQRRKMVCWSLKRGATQHLVRFDRTSLEVTVDNKMIASESNFSEDGSSVHFDWDGEAYSIEHVIDDRKYSLPKVKLLRNGLELDHC